MLKPYLKYLKKRVNAHGIHSPFVFAFYNEIIKKSKLANNPALEELRKELSKNDQIIQINDFGAGSRKNKSNKRSIAEIAKNAAVKQKYGELLAQIITHYNCKTILEFGTSVGIGTAYMAATPNPNSVLTFEGCAETAKIASKNFEKLKLDNIDARVGEFSSLMPTANGMVFDLVFIDGNHKMKPTLEYFKFALAHTHDDSFIIFDDIHWSDEMESAWVEIQKSNAINVSMDLFQFGICCKRSGQRKEHFILKF